MIKKQMNIHNLKDYLIIVVKQEFDEYTKRVSKHKKQNVLDFRNEYFKLLNQSVKKGKGIKGYSYKDIIDTTNYYSS